MKSIKLLSFLLILQTTFLFAQRPSELRRQGQTNPATTTGENLFEIDDPDFEKTDIPAEWENESAVVLMQKMDFAYERRNTKFISEETLRRRVKLLDKSAVKEFSEFYFRQSINSGFKIVKPDGTEVVVDLKDAVEVKTEIPRFYRTSYTYSKSYFKVAVPGLEEGDIVDYYYQSQDSEAMRGVDEHTFSKFLVGLNSQYSSVKSKYTFQVDRGFFLNFSSYNGAPKIKYVGTGIDSKGRARSNLKVYELVDTKRPRYESGRWINRYEKEPYIKFQVLFVAPRNLRTTEEFLDEDGEVKEAVTYQEIMAKVSDVINLSRYTQVRETLNYIRRNHRKETNPKKLAQIAYYYMRFNSIPFSYKESLLFTKYEPRLISEDMFTVRSMLFAGVMYEVLDALDVDVEIIATADAELGGLDNLLIMDELVLGVRVGDEIIFPHSMHTTIDLPDYNVEGSKAIVFKPVRKGPPTSYDEIIIPVSSADDNTEKTELDIGLSEDMSYLTVRQINTFKGALKKQNASSVLFTYDYITKERKKYGSGSGGINYGSYLSTASEKRMKEVNKKMKEIQKEALKRNAQGDFEVEDFGSIRVTKNGRYGRGSALMYNQSYKIKGLLNKAGNKYILDVGKLIGEQVALDEDEMQRSQSVSMPFAKTYINEITITIPSGWEVKGLEDLETNVDTPQGTFTSSAKVEEFLLIIKTTKKYKNKYVSPDDWNDMVQFLEAAYEFSQKKVLITPKG